MNYSDSSSEDSCGPVLPIGLSTTHLTDLSGKLQPITQNVFQGEIQEDEFNLPYKMRYTTLLARCDEILKKQTDNSKKLNVTVKAIRKNRKTMLNVQKIANQIGRDVDHLKTFILNRLYSTGTLNEAGFLIIDGKYSQGELESEVQNFIENFVKCKSCNNEDSTEIIRENRLFFIRCCKCNGNVCIGSFVEGLNSRKKQ
ncbi:IF2B [Hepatospora eriocheir]|uniref:IF2B n=1 Tax=Hepatospora eriocheir TaxID=1081669 RepID=A0A1X0QAG7_9MICR|nr:IF2B [Hepatospora eriocheir]